MWECITKTNHHSSEARKNEWMHSALVNFEAAWNIRSAYIKINRSYPDLAEQLAGSVFSTCFFFHIRLHEHNQRWSNLNQGSSDMHVFLRWIQWRERQKMQGKAWRDWSGWNVLERWSKAANLGVKGQNLWGSVYVSEVWCAYFDVEMLGKKVPNNFESIWLRTFRTFNIVS